MTTEGRPSDKGDRRAELLAISGCGFVVILCLVFVAWAGLRVGRWVVARATAVWHVRQAVARGAQRFTARLVPAQPRKGEQAALWKHWEALARAPARIGTEGPKLLYRAAGAGDLELVGLLLDAGVDPNAGEEVPGPPPEPGGPPARLQAPALQAAASHGHIDVMRLLVERGADVNRRGPEGDTALHAAASFGTIEAARWLLDHGADVDARNEAGDTPLADAVLFECDMRVAPLLIQRGADVNAANERGETVLHKAVTRTSMIGETGPAALAKALLENGADPNARDCFGDTPLHAALGERLGNGDQMAVLLLDRGADASAANQAGLTPLHCAAARGWLPVAMLLVQKGADVNARAEGSVAAVGQDSSWWALPWWQREPVGLWPPCRGERQTGRCIGETPLHIAAAQGHLEVAELLLSEGAAVDARTTDGLTPLHAAAYGGNEEVVTSLLARGADVDAEDVDGWTPLHEAAFNNHREAARILLEGGARQDVYTAAGLGDPALVESYLKADPDLLRSTDRLLKWTPLHWAANAGDERVVALLLNQGADVNARDFRDWTPLRLAELGQYEGAASLLRASGGVK